MRKTRDDETSPRDDLVHYGRSTSGETVRHNHCIERLMFILGHQPRMAILRALAESPLSAGVIADTVGLQSTMASYELRILQKHGLISGTRVKNNRFYRLTNRVRIHQHEGATQVAISNDLGQWALIQSHQRSTRSTPATIPTQFIC